MEDRREDKEAGCKSGSYRLGESLRILSGKCEKRSSKQSAPVFSAQFEVYNEEGLHAILDESLNVSNGNISKIKSFN